MEKLGLLVSILCFIGGIWWVIAKLEGSIIAKILMRTFGFLSCILSGVYILNYYGII